MAKKKRTRVWWYPVFDEEYNELLKTKTIGQSEKKGYPVFFDTQNAAYAFALSKRLETKRNEAGDPIIDEATGYAKLHNHGYIYLIGIKGNAFNWKQVDTLTLPPGIKGDAIVSYENIVTTKLTTHKVIKETEDAYKRHVASPLAQAGGVVFEPAADATKEVQPTH